MGRRVGKVEPLRLRTWPNKLRNQGIINSIERYGFIQSRDVGDDIHAEGAVESNFRSSVRT
jgi:hypothetical protein